MVASYVSISNRSLLACGARAQISSLQEDSEEANSINLLFNPTFEQLGRAAHWGALRAQQTLTLLAAAPGTPENQNGTTMPLPPQPWLYSYSYPSTCLQMRFIVPTFTFAGSGTPISPAMIQANPCIPGSGQIPYAIAYSVDINNSPIRVILCNQSMAQAVFTINSPNPSTWDSSFEQAYVAALAAFLVPALTMNMQLLEMNVKIAEAAISQARLRDGNESPVSVDHQPDWIRARATGTIYGTGYANGYGGGYGYSDVTWPSWG